MLTLLLYLFRRVSPVIIIKQHEEYFSIYRSKMIVEDYYYVRILPWWKPWRWQTLRAHKGADGPAKFKRLKQARRAAHELQLGLRLLDNSTIVEVHPSYGA